MDALQRGGMRRRADDGETPGCNCIFVLIGFKFTLSCIQKDTNMLLTLSYTQLSCSPTGYYDSVQARGLLNFCLVNQTQLSAALDVLHHQDAERGSGDSGH